jgi:cytochrome c oxidase assembly factor CtaG
MDGVTTWVGLAAPGPAAWTFDPVMVGALLAAASVYAAGVAHVRRTIAGSVPVDRIASWYGGLTAATIALVSPLDAYADVSFLAHMFQHVLLTLVAPPLLALGAPVTLALRATRPATARRLTHVLAGPVAAALARPAVGWVLFVGVSWAVHFSPLFDLSLRAPTWHAAEHVLWLAAALVYWWPLVGVDPSPHPVSFPARLLSLFLTMPAMSFLALSIFSAGTPLYPTYAATPPPWTPDALGDQRNAAVAMWLIGNIGLVIAMLIVASAWKRHDDERQRREDARLDAAAEPM